LVQQRVRWGVFFNKVMKIQVPKKGTNI
jgi:hypothetical protein